LHLQPYSPDSEDEWNAFVDRSRNGIFQFRRPYMDYHADRFTDCSLIIRDDTGRILALLPASIAGGVVTSHAGLTFGGFITDERMKVADMLALFEALRTYLQELQVTRLVYKAVPHLYHRFPAEEDRYALFRIGATVAKCDVSSTIRTDARLPLSKGRRYAIKQARKAGLLVEQSNDFAAFMKLEEALLADKYGTSPTHSGAEMALLASRFPERIKLFQTRRGDELLAGIVMYEYGTVAHAQYIAASEEGKRVGALDLIIDQLVRETYAHLPFFDFGISTERQGRFLNEGLVANKQSFGGRAVVHETFDWDLAA
jgi:hypothetical protein